MSGALQIVLIVVAVGYILVRRMIGEQAEARRMLILPTVLVIIGLSDVSKDVKTPAAVGILVATAAISVAIGALRGASVRISTREGVAFVQYTALTVILWVANVVIKFGANAGLRVIDPNDSAALSNSLMLTLGAGMLIEGLIVLARALRADHRVVWQAGKDGAPHQMSPFLDDIQRNFRDRR
jgi:hypothetical protein